VSELGAQIADWIREATGSSQLHAERQKGGNRRQAWSVDVTLPDGARRELFLRFDPADPAETGDPFTIWREAAIYGALRDTDVRLPRLVAVHPRSQAMLTERVAGESDFFRVAKTPAGECIARDLVRQLAILHHVDALTIEFPGRSPRLSVADHIRAEIALWAERYEQLNSPEPMIELGLSWLRQNVPDVAGQARVVHGDFGPGNFMFADNRVSALVDWELTHLGDPVEDLAWLSMRSIFEPIPDFAARIREYAELVGASVDLARLRYHRVFVHWRVVILRHAAVGDSAPSGDVANGLLSRAVNRRLFVEALAEAENITPRSPDQSAEEPLTEFSWLYDSALNVLREVIVPRSVDERVVSKAKSIARLVKFLRDADRLSTQAHLREIDSLAQHLGHPTSLAAGRLALAGAIRRGELGIADALDHLSLVVADETQMMRSSLGALADRHLPDPGLG
jgi:aminoglycoside phosphotransferase (APT) family kinase protein